ncbi:MAG TPA: hypothetical protein VNA25_22960 [Phycisphaerae bacterium]|nr:hypothetical protein [Phycisphaerae bacterium]
MIDGEVVCDRVSDSATMTLYGHYWVLGEDLTGMIEYLMEYPVLEEEGGAQVTGAPGEIFRVEVWHIDDEGHWDYILGYTVGLCGGDGLGYWWGDWAEWSVYTGRSGVLYELAIIQETGWPESYLAVGQGGTSWSALQMTAWFPDA